MNEIIFSIIWSIIVTLITFYFIRKREIELQWRKEKLQLYINFTNSLSLITDNEWSIENVSKFEKSCNDLYLLSSKKVIDNLKIFLNEISFSNKNVDLIKRQENLNWLFYEIRKDLWMSKSESNIDVKLRTWIKKLNN